MSKPDFYALIFALILHTVLALGVISLPERPPVLQPIVEMEIKTPVQPPVVVVPPAPEPPPEPEPERKITQKKPKELPPPAVAPPPNQTTKQPPQETAKPVFGLTESSTVADSTVSMPTGNTTMIDPSKSAPKTGPVAPLAPQTGPPAQKYEPISDLYLKKAPEIDNEACGASIKYPPEAEQMGIEGQVRLRIELDEKGKVRSVRVTRGLGHGVDEAIARAIRTHPECRFSPAVANDGKPAAYVIDPYIFTLELSR